MRHSRRWHGRALLGRLLAGGLLLAGTVRLRLRLAARRRLSAAPPLPKPASSAFAPELSPEFRS